MANLQQKGTMFQAFLDSYESVDLTKAHDVLDHMLAPQLSKLVPFKYRNLGFIPPTPEGECWAAISKEIRVLARCPHTQREYISFYISHGWELDWERNSVGIWKQYYEKVLFPDTNEVWEFLMNMWEFWDNK